MTRLKRVRNRVVNNFFIRKLYSLCETAHKIILKLLITRHFSSTSRRYRDADFLRVARMTWRMLVGKVIDPPLCNLYLGDNSPNIYIYIYQNTSANACLWNHWPDARHPGADFPREIFLPSWVRFRQISLFISYFYFARGADR